VLREQLGRNRLRLTEEQRRRLAVRAEPLGRAVLRNVATLVTPETLLGWYRSGKRLDFRRIEFSDTTASSVTHFAADSASPARYVVRARVTIEPALAAPANDVNGVVRRRERLGGLLSFYHREAA
jgi:hypothetical protein